MAVDQQGGSGHEARIHGHGFLDIGPGTESGIELGIEPGVESGVEPTVESDEYETLPAGAIAFGIGFQLVQKAFLELENFFDAHAGDKRLGSSDGSVGEHNIFKFVVAGGQDGGALVDFGGIEQVEHGKMLHGEYFVHAFEAEAALAVEKVGDVGLFESGLLGEEQATEFACLDALPKHFAEIILQDFELHGGEYSENPHFSRKERARNGAPGSE